ncbi:unnamed protein product [Soboliphyme baturini]|uniref:Ig-like domain-containing protein n=1 Tax=Soboliphyme baturini TaxID=241478 RepID=A0A183IQK1_9BILA|nr:unnamed protein product [Soboliphyme baturini]
MKKLGNPPHMPVMSLEDSVLFTPPVQCKEEERDSVTWTVWKKITTEIRIDTITMGTTSVTAHHPPSYGTLDCLTFREKPVL